MLAIFSMIHLCDADLKARRFKLIDSDKLNRLTFLLIISAIATSLLVVNPQAILAKSQITHSQDEARSYPGTLLFSWGVGIRIESIFPLLANDSSLREMRIYGLGVFTHAPFSRAHIEETEGRGFVQRVRSPDGIFIVASENNINLLRIWCHERYRANLRDESISSGPMTDLKRVKCE